LKENAERGRKKDYAEFAEDREFTEKRHCGVGS
jgi:hypothetical protein